MTENPRFRFLLYALVVLCNVGLAGTMIYDRFSRNELSQDVSPPTFVAHWRSLASVGTPMGPPSAPVTIIEFSDFQCPYCAKLHWTLQELRSRNPERVRVVFRHFPGDRPFAFEAAEATECAGAQGAFERYQDLLFANQDSVATTPWTKFAHEAGIPRIEEFEKCLATHQFADRVREDASVARELRLRGTPTLLINGRVVLGAVSLAELESWLE